MEPWMIELLKGSPMLALALIVWFSLRDGRREAAADRLETRTLLRSIDLRLSKVLDRTRTTPAMGVPQGKHPRKRTAHDSDMETGETVALPRTVTDEEVG